MGRLSELWKRLETYVIGNLKSFNSVEESERKHMKAVAGRDVDRALDRPEDDDPGKGTTLTTPNPSSCPIKEAYSTWYDTPTT
jgi:hypothetical protein